MKTILITGASQGIGKYTARLFASLGYKVAINYNKSEDKANLLCKEIISFGGNAITVKADISKPCEVKQMIDFVIKCFGHIDVLINNAGISNKQLLIDETDDRTLEIINTNLCGSIYASKYVIPHMLNYGKGKIINISSIWGNLGASCEATYSASKAGIIGLTKSLAKEYGYNNICVNCIAPGIIDTEINKNLTQNELKNIIKNIPANRIGSCEEIANLALFLADDTGDYITGQIITVDGGFTL